MTNQRMVLLTGGVIGLVAVVLVFFGNPVNMGICVACFIRDMAGSVGLHSAEAVQYIRPEIIGFILGAFIIALATKEYRPVGGSSPMIRFILGVFMMVGALMFLGCPLRMVLRLAGGDLNALVGLAGFAAGIFAGIFFLKKGFTLGRAYVVSKSNGAVLPVIMMAMLVFLLVKPAFIRQSVEGPGSMAAPVLIALAAGLIVGALCQKSRLCMAGGIRDLFLIKSPHLAIGFVAIFVVALVGNLAMGNFTLSFQGQPVAHTDGLWNFLGMALVGLSATMLGGCPLRQTILAGEGNTDSAITFLGLFVGAAFAHNFGLASSGAGPTVNGQIAVIIGFVVLTAIGFTNLDKGAA